MEIKITQGLNEEARTIRQEVFVEEQEFREEFDDREDTSLHAVLYLEGTPIATARIFPKTQDGAVYKIGRIAVMRPYRGQGWGRKIVEEMEQYVQRLGAREVELSAQVRARGFYEKLGYRGTGESYYEEHVPHIRMTKQLKKQEER